MAVLALGWPEVAVALGPSLLSGLVALVAVLVARRRRRVDDTVAEVQGEDEHAKAALDVLLATIAAQGETEAHLRERAADDAKRHATELAAARADADHYRRRVDQEARRKHRARNRAHAWAVRAELVERLAAEAGVALPAWTPPPDDEPVPGIGEDDDSHGRAEPAT